MTIFNIFFSPFFQLHQMNGLFTSLFTAFKSDLLALFLIKLIYLQLFHNKSFFLLLFYFKFIIDDEQGICYFLFLPFLVEINQSAHRIITYICDFT